MSSTKFVLFMVAMIAGIWSFMSFTYSAGFAPLVDMLRQVINQLPMSYENAFTLWYIGGSMLLVLLLIGWVTVLYLLFNFLYFMFWKSSSTA